MSLNQILDFYAMVVMHGINGKKKPVDVLLRQKVKSDVFTTELVEKAFSVYGQVRGLCLLCYYWTKI